VGPVSCAATVKEILKEEILKRDLWIERDDASSLEEEILKSQEI
jgi:hypothetical protein